MLKLRLKVPIYKKKVYVTNLQCDVFSFIFLFYSLELKTNLQLVTKSGNKTNLR